MNFNQTVTINGIKIPTLGFGWRGSMIGIAMGCALILLNILEITPAVLHLFAGLSGLYLLLWGMITFLAVGETRMFNEATSVHDLYRAGATEEEIADWTAEQFYDSLSETEKEDDKILSETKAPIKNNGEDEDDQSFSVEGLRF